MISVRAQAVRWVGDEPIPGWVEVHLELADGTVVKLFDKPPVLTFTLSPSPLPASATNYGSGTTCDAIAKPAQSMHVSSTAWQSGFAGIGTPTHSPKRHLCRTSSAAPRPPADGLHIRGSGRSGRWEPYDPDMEGPSPRLLASLVRALAVLAMPASDQVDWLRSLGVLGGPPNVDELALELSDGALLSAQLVEARWLPASVSGPLRELDGLLSTMSGPANAALWNPGALASAPEWDDVRSKAKAILFLI